MSGQSPDVVLYDSNGNALAVANAAVIPTSAIMSAGSDGTDLRFLAVNSSGQQIIVGAAASGSAISGNPVLIAGSDGTDARNILTDATGRIVVKSICSTPAQTTVAASASSVSILASNTSRIGATIFNDSTVTMYLIMGTPASTTSYSVQINPNGYFELPYGYTGAVAGIWGSATGNARITELT
jgi:hypothetical protein